MPVNRQGLVLTWCATLRKEGGGCLHVALAAAELNDALADEVADGHVPARRLPDPGVTGLATPQLAESQVRVLSSNNGHSVVFLPCTRQN